MDSKFILSVLSHEYDKKEWAFFEELRIGGGFGKDSEQRFDAWALCYYPSKRNVSRCFEVKTSRGDFLSEIKNPKKRRAGLRLSNEFYFVTPEKMVEITEIPVECGLLEITELGNIRTVIPAPFRDIEPPTWLFMASICRREISKDSVLHTDKAYWENIGQAVKKEVVKITNKYLAEWTAKDNPVVLEAIKKMTYEIYNVDVQKLMGDKHES